MLTNRQINSLLDLLETCHEIKVTYDVGTYFKLLKLINVNNLENSKATYHRQLTA